jgi:SMI1 / KNR4 family (SUKH-1)
MAAKWPLMTRRGPFVDESILAAFEASIGHRLPEDYRQFLLEVNGGRPDDCNCRASFGAITTFLSLGDPNDARNLESANRYPEPPSRDLLYIGYDGCGTDVYVVIAGERRGQVWIEDTEDPRPEGSNPRVLWHDRRDMEKVADSFEAFMRTLGPLKSAAQEE